MEDALAYKGTRVVEVSRGRLNQGPISLRSDQTWAFFDGALACRVLLGVVPLLAVDVGIGPLQLRLTDWREERSWPD